MSTDEAFAFASQGTYDELGFAMCRFEPGQIVRVTRPGNHAYGRLAIVVMANPHQVKIQFVDLSKSLMIAQNMTGSLALAESSELTLVEGIPLTG